MEFEAEVRRVAEAVWGLEPGGCQPEHYPDDSVVRELDGMVRLRDVTHLLMVTTSTKLQKIKDDTKKLHAAELIERRTATAVSKWIITEKQLSAEHIHYARQSNASVLTLDDFRRRFFDGRRYISLRAKSPFGSARNPVDDSVTFPEGSYVPLPIRVAKPALAAIRDVSTDGGPMTSLEKIKDGMVAGDTYVLVAPFGGGKSLTTRELFQLLAGKYLAGESKLVPLVLNLREHWGQDHFDEILDRHARAIGYSPREDLIIAWRAGFCCLLLDGFDEVASQTVVRRDDVNFMRDARRLALTGVRDFLSKVPTKIGIWICGRDHYFDTVQELAQTLVIANRRFTLLALDEFTEEGANDYLRRHGIQQELPDWLPRKPLMLAYLTQLGLFDEILSIDGSRGFGHAWDAFLHKVADREAALESAVMDPATLRTVLERLAHIVRGRVAGTGPISGNDLSEAYSAETKQVAGEGVLAQLQRLPGLTQREQDPGARSFVDEDMLAALQGSALARKILGEVTYPQVTPLSGLTQKAVSMAIHILRGRNATCDSVLAVMERGSRQAFGRPEEDQYLADCFSIACGMAQDEGSSIVDCRGVEISCADIEVIDLGDIQVDNLVISDCVVGRVTLSQTGARSTIRFRTCSIGTVVGATNQDGLPRGMFDEKCEVANYDNLGTNSAVLRSDLPASVKALVTVLRKLYCQVGAGRKLEALRRGITQTDVGNYIPAIISLLEQHQFISVFNKVVHPVRKQHDRVNRILSAPALSDDLVVQAARALSRT